MGGGQVPVSGKIAGEEQGMRKIKALIFFALNAGLLALSWYFYKYPDGDEYLVLFIVPVLAIGAPYILSVRMMALLLLGNLVFMGYYVFVSVLNPLDFAVMGVLIAASMGTSYAGMIMTGAIERYNRINLDREEGKYNRIVKELEGLERKGRIVERELARISRLYEITKKLESVLKFNELFDILFAFIKDNFRFEKVHFLIFTDGEFSSGISKKVSEDSDIPQDTDEIIDYKALVAHMAEKDNKPFYLERQDSPEFFEKVKVKENTFFAFPLFVKKISVIVAIEGSTKLGYNRFNIIVPQIALELRKVELYEQVEQLSIVDGLTGVYLRRYLMIRLEEEVDRAMRLGMTFSIGMVDIDHFKKCNDDHGHLVGDAVLKGVAERLKESVREIDMVARYGGEEFCVVLPETTRELAFTVAERLRRSVDSSKVKAFDEKVKVTVSVGIATFPDNGRTAAELIEVADMALYKAKRKGRNMVCGA
jgi:diguanylate cyclase (GGDEF)-like protein